MDGVLLKRVTILWVSGILVPKCSSRKSHRNQGCFIYSNGMSKYDTCLLQPWPSRAQLWLPRICNPPVITCDSCFRSLPIPKLIPRPFAGFYQNHWCILQLCPGFPQLSGSHVHRDVRQLLLLLEGPHAIADLRSDLGPRSGGSHQKTKVWK